MSARIGTHEIRNPIDPQPTPEFPSENYVDLRSGTRYRREFLGCHGRVLLVSDIANHPASTCSTDAPRPTPTTPDRAS